MSHTNFLGIPVEGDITKSYRQEAEAWPLEKFQSLLTTIIEHPKFQGLRWRQYTPYFNDGDPCIFGVDSVSVRLEGMNEEAGDYEDGLDEIDYPGDDLERIIGKKERTNWRDGSVIEPATDGEEPELGRALKELNKGISGGHFDNVLIDAFGDHAVVTVSRDKISVEFYEHD